jgi:sulfur relay (sulfurtransferase) complex TusBCD TusD component (DsrE family)
MQGILSTADPKFSALTEKCKETPKAKYLLTKYIQRNPMSTNYPDHATTLLITHAGLGKADPELQTKLARTYLQLINEYNLLPAAICFYTEGVNLVVEGSPVLEMLSALEAKGVRLIVCNTCLNYYDLAEKVRVGIIGGMADIIEAQWKADRVITL